jgi:4-hydroxyphenylpyruvate dioxygenase-like putative hemolysin
MYFLDRGADLGRVWDVEFAPVDDATEPTGLARVDHIAQSIPFEELPTWRKVGLKSEGGAFWFRQSKLGCA